MTTTPRMTEEEARRELDRVGITGDEETMRLLAARIVRGEVTAEQLAEVLDG